MTIRIRRPDGMTWWPVRLAILLALSSPVPAALADDPQRVQWYGDFRARLESDWDSRKSDGSEREDRDRLRARARLGVNVRAQDSVGFGLRLRTGAENSHQSPHVTLLDFDDNDTGDAAVSFDKWFLKYGAHDAWAWIGRDSAPFWQQNELFWDEDVTLAGAAAGFKLGGFALNSGYFSLPVGMRAFAGNLAALQLVYSGRWNDHGYTLAAGHHVFDSNAADPDAARLRNGNGLRDYRISVFSAQWKTPVAGRPVAVGIDVHRNGEDYPAGTPNGDQTGGHVWSLVYGQIKDAGDWLIGYYRADIEQFAVNASYAQDDWMRWGSADETDASNFKGFEARCAYAVSKDSNLVARYYDVEALTGVQDGKRLRIDYNFRF